MKELIVLSGWPGVGKSKWHDTYRATHPHKNIHVISSDDIRKELTGAFNDLSQDKLMWELYEQRLQALYRQNEACTIILDSTCLTNKKRLHWAKAYPNFAKKTLIIIQADLDLCRQRNGKRLDDKKIPDEAVTMLHGYFQLPDEEVSTHYDAILYIDGNGQL